MGWTRTVVITIALAVLLGTAVPFMGEPAVADSGEVLNISRLEVPEKGNPKLDGCLNRLVSGKTPKRADLSAGQGEIEKPGEEVRVIIECEPGQLGAAAPAAVSLGASVEMSYRDLLQVVTPVRALTALANTPAIRFVRLPNYLLPAVVTSEGVALIDADEWQTAGYTGAGVKVGILDGGFSGYATRQAEGELPATVTTWWAPSIGGPGSSGHGTACAEIIHDIAPDAQFYLANFGTIVEWANAVSWLIEQEVDVISHSIAWFPGGPGDGTGAVCTVVDEAGAAGILWSQSAGNYARRHWQGDFGDTDGDGWHEFDLGLDESNTIEVSIGETITVFLKWDDTWGASANDYNLYLIDKNSIIVAYSQGIQDGNDNPTEVISYAATYSGVYHIVIGKEGNPESVILDMTCAYRELQYQVAAGSLAVPADSPSAMTVGAVPWNDPVTLEYFSSRGPTTDSRTKPDLVAPDGVTTVSQNPFYGTSAAAPGAAGAAALVKERYPAYTPAEIQSFLESRTVDLGDAGKDNLFGSGRLKLGSSNSPPAVGSVSISPEVAYTGTELAATASGWSDADGESESYLWQWQKRDGDSWEDIAGATGEILGSVSFIKEEQLKVICTPFDGIDTGTPVEDTITISNSLPTAPVVDVTPEVPLTADDLVCSITTPGSDADDDAVTYSYAWYKPAFPISN